MSGRWHVRPRTAAHAGAPWLVLRGAEREAVLWNGPVLELHARGPRRLGPDILAAPPDLDAMLARLRRGRPARAVGEALLDQRLVAGIGNMWMAEALWQASVSPWRTLGDVADDELPRRCWRRRRADARLGRRGRGPRTQRLPPRRAARARAAATRIRSRGPGRRQPDRVLVSRLPGRRGTRAGVVT